MEELIKMIDTSLLEVKPFMEYLESFKNYRLVEKDIQRDMSKVSLLGESETIIIRFLDCDYAKWWDISRYHPDGTKYEQTEIQLFQEIQEGKYNRVVYFSGHNEDDCYAHIIWSGYTFLDDKLVTGSRNTRVVSKLDLPIIQYAPGMNLKELAGMVDYKGIPIIRKRSLKNVQILTLELGNYL